MGNVKLQVSAAGWLDAVSSEIEEATIYRCYG